MSETPNTQTKKQTEQSETTTTKEGEATSQTETTTQEGEEKSQAGTTTQEGEEKSQTGTTTQEGEEKSQTETSNAHEGEQSSAQGEQSSAQGEQSSAQGEQSSAQGEQSSAQGEQSSAQGEQSSAQGEQPAADEQADKPAEPAKKSEPAKKEEKPSTKLPKEFKRGFDVSHYQLERLLDNQKGLFIFAATNLKDEEPAEIRIERIDKKRPGLTTEIALIPYLSESLCFPRFYEWGEQGEFRWVTCELLGPSLKFIKWKLPKQRFTQYSALHGSLALLRAIQELHKRGIVHGDIQPDNIIVRPNKEQPLVLTNFAVSRRYCWPEGVKELPPIDMTPATIDISKLKKDEPTTGEEDYGFHNESSATKPNNEASTENNNNETSNAESNNNADGNNENSNAENGDSDEEQGAPEVRDPSIFNSVNALQGGEITRVDDLESWFYVMVDMLEGNLPFSAPSQTASKESVLSAKQSVTPDKLTKDLPDKLKDVWTYISSLQPTDDPDYEKIANLVLETIKDLKLIPEDYDWNKLPVRKVKKISAIDFRALDNENNYLPIFDHERNVSQTPPPPPPNCSIA